MVGATDCRSADPWFNSGWKSWFVFVTGSDNVLNQIIQMFNNKIPIRTVITTITRKSVNIKTVRFKTVRFKTVRFKNSAFQKQCVEKAVC